MTATLRRLPADHRFQAIAWAAVGDPRKATAYEVLVDGKVVGHVGSRSRPNEVIIGRIRYRRRGFTRSWAAGEPYGGALVTTTARTRQSAVDALLTRL